MITQQLFFKKTTSVKLFWLNHRLSELSRLQDPFLLCYTYTMDVTTIIIVFNLATFILLCVHNLHAIYASLLKSIPWSPFSINLYSYFLLLSGFSSKYYMHDKHEMAELGHVITGQLVIHVYVYFVVKTCHIKLWFLYLEWNSTMGHNQTCVSRWKIYPWPCFYLQ